MLHEINMCSCHDSTSWHSCIYRVFMQQPDTSEMCKFPELALTFISDRADMLGANVGAAHPTSVTTLQGGDLAERFAKDVAGRRPRGTQAVLQRVCGRSRSRKRLWGQ